MPPDCKSCKLFFTSRAVLVPGEGNPDAEIVLVGEALGAEEEAQHGCFRGRAGWLLDKCLYDAQLSRSEVWICNSVRCRPTNALGKNRAPTMLEINACRPALEEELAGRSFKVIVALGASATHSIFGHEAPTGGVLENQGKVLWSNRFNCWVVCTLHPAYALRKQSEAEWITADLEKAKRIAWEGEPPTPRQPDITIVRTLEQAFAMRETLLRAQDIYFDWETTGLHLRKDIGFCLSLSDRENHAYVVPRFLAGRIPAWNRQDLRRLDQEVLRPVFLSDVPKGGHHLQFDIPITQTTLGDDCIPANVQIDTMLLSHLHRNHLGERAHGLKRISDVFTPYGRYDDPLDKWLIANGYTKDGKPDGGCIWLAPDELVQPYCGTDAVVPRYVAPRFIERVKEEQLWDLYCTERIPLMLEYAQMDRTGVRMDQTKMDGMSQEVGLAIDLVEARLAQVAGKPINVNSPPQVVTYLYDELGLPVLGRTETGAPSTKEDFLKELAPMAPAVPLILHARSYRKLKGTFIDGTQKDEIGGLRRAVDADWFARMATILTGPETFRLATRKPFPIHTLPRPLVLWNCPVGHGHYLFDQCCGAAEKVSLNIRGMIRPDFDDEMLLEADYCQQEYGIAACLSGQTDWEEAIFDRREDAHEYVMKLLKGKTKRDYQHLVDGRWLFTSDQAADEYKNDRSDIKRLNFMILYRGGAKKLARNLSTKGDPAKGIPPKEMHESEAAGIISDYFERLEQIKWWQYRLIKELRETGRVVGAFKTFRILPGIYSPDRFDQYEAERAGCNFPVQNAGYHIMARGLLRIASLWRGKLPLRAPFPGRVKFSIHDEIVASVRQDLAEEGADQMRRCMEHPHPELTGGCGVARGVLVDIKETPAWAEPPVREWKATDQLKKVAA